LALIPTVIVLLVWTDGYHGLVRNHIRLDYSGTFPVIAKQYGIAFYVHAAYSHILNLITLMLLLRAVFIRRTIYRKQVLTLLIGVCLIVIPNILYILKLSPIRHFDITPVFFGPAGLVMAWSIFRYRMFALVPLAWETVIKTMDAGVVIMDQQDRILDINPAFKKMISLPDSELALGYIDKVCKNIPEFSLACKNRTISHTEFNIQTSSGIKVFELLLSTLKEDGDEIGRVAVIYEITAKKKAELEFLTQQRKLAIVEERERLARDMHDNLGQVLGFINIQTQAIRKELFDAGSVAVLDKLDQLTHVTQSTQKELREFISEAKSSAEKEKDIIKTLFRIISDFESQCGITVSLDLPSGFTGKLITTYKRKNILYIIKEALNNIQKHADAKHVNIFFRYEAGQIIITVADDGKGFDTSTAKNETKSGFGLAIMRERAIEIGGQLKIESEPGRGCTIQLNVPIDKEKDFNEGNAGR
jgi:PAS domain S-box-containing protein